MFNAAVTTAREGAPLQVALETAAAGCCPICASVRQVVLEAVPLRNLKECRSCGVLYMDPRPSREALLAYFSRPEEMSAERLELRYRHGRHKVLSAVARYIHGRRSGGRILDTGCANGYFLDHFFRKSDWEAWGVELSEKLAARAAQAGIDVHAGDIRSANFASGFFDVVTVLDAFYYFPDPRREIQELRRILKSDGLLVMDFPLAECHLFRTGKLGRLLTGNHAPNGVDHFLYAPRSIRFLLEASGFEVRDVHPLPGNAPGRWLPRVLYWGYSSTSAALWSLSAKRLMLGPRFLASASPGNTSLLPN